MILTASNGTTWRKGVRDSDYSSLPAPFARNLDHVATVSGDTLYILQDDRGNYYGRNHGGRMVCRVFRAGVRP